MSLFLSDPVIPANGGIVMPQTKNRYVTNSGSGEKHIQQLPIVPPVTVHKTAQVPDGKVFTSLSFMGEFYFRIWFFPPFLNALNPRIGSAAYATVWNAYPYHNTLTSVLAKGADYVETNMKAPRVFDALETADITYTITHLVSKNIRAEYTYRFTEGEGHLIFTATVGSDLMVFPETPLREVWEWRTNILKKAYGGEQRIALRSVPRRKFSGLFSILEEDEAAYWLKKLYKDYKNLFSIPLPQYRGFLTETTNTGGRSIVFDPMRTDLRVGEKAYIAKGDDKRGIVVDIGQITDTGAVLNEPLPVAAEKGMGICPVVSVYFEDKSILHVDKMYEVFNARCSDGILRPVFPRPNSKPAIIRCDEIIVLDKPQLARSSINKSISIDTSKFDNKINLPERNVFVDRSFVDYTCSFHMDRYLHPEDMDWWRNVLYELRGMQKRVLVPTWRCDFKVKRPPDNGTDTILIEGSDYNDHFYQNPGSQYLWIQTRNGNIARRVLKSDINIDGDNLLVLSDNFGANSKDVMIECISLLLVSRLAADSVTFEHYPMHSKITLRLQTIDR